MKNIDQLSVYIDTIGKKLEKKFIKAHQETAEQILKDVIDSAPLRSGRYIGSIKKSDTFEKDGVYKTFIYTDLPVGGDNPKWSNVPLGALLEWGTGIQGASTNTYPHGYSYRLTPWCYYDEYLHMFVTTDGMIARPHFLPSLQKNKNYYLDKLSEAMRK